MSLEARLKQLESVLGRGRNTQAQQAYRDRLAFAIMGIALKASDRLTPEQHIALEHLKRVLGPLPPEPPGHSWLPHDMLERGLGEGEFIRRILVATLGDEPNEHFRQVWATFVPTIPYPWGVPREPT